MAYTLVGLRTRVRSKLKDSSYDATSIDDFLNDAQLEISNLFQWSFFEKVIAGSLTVGEYTFEQQSDHQLTQRLLLINPDDSTTYYDLTNNYKPKDTFFDIYPVPDAQDNALPVYWTEYGDQIYFNCPVDDNYTLRQFYYRLPTEMTLDADVPDLPRDFQECLILGAQYRAEEQRDNYDYSAVVQGKFNDKVGDLIQKYSVVQFAAPENVVSPFSGVQDEWSK